MVRPREVVTYARYLTELKHLISEREKIEIEITSRAEKLDPMAGGGKIFQEMVKDSPYLKTEFLGFNSFLPYKTCIMTTGSCRKVCLSL